MNIKLDLNFVIFQIAKLVEHIESLAGSSACHVGSFKWSAYIISLRCRKTLKNMPGRLRHGTFTFCLEMIHCQGGQMEVQSVRLNQRNIARKRFATKAPYTMTTAMNMYSPQQVLASSMLQFKINFATSKTAIDFAYLN